MSVRVSHHALRWLLVVLGLATALGNMAGAVARQVTDPEDAGVIEEGRYESPNFGYEVEWELPWQAPQPGIDFATTEEGNDALNIAIWLPSGYTIASLRIVGIDPEQGDQSASEFIERIIEYYQSDELFDRQNDPDDIDVLLEDEGRTAYSTLYLAESSTGPQFRYVEYRLDPEDEFISFISFRSDVDTFEGNVKAAQASVSIDGDSPIQAYDTDEILEAGLDFVEGGSTANDDGEEGADASDRDDDPDTGSDLDDVRDHVDELSASADEFIEIVSSESLSQAQADRANEILGLWLDAPDVAASVEFPRSESAIEDAYIEYTDTIAGAAESFITFIDPDSTERESEAAFDDFVDAIDALPGLEADLDDLLDEAGA